jgi:hypothetical protein
MAKRSIDDFVVARLTLLAERRRRSKKKILIGQMRFREVATQDVLALFLYYSGWAVGERKKVG